jgi:hypothetical protein
MISLKAATFALAAGGLLIAADGPASAQWAASANMGSGGSPSSPFASTWKLRDFGKYRGAGEWRTRVKFGRDKFRGGDKEFGGDGRGRHDRGRGRGPRDDWHDYTAFGLGWSDSYLYRYNRTGRGAGFFGDGIVAGPGRYLYDRGYPYDHYNYSVGSFQDAGAAIDSPSRPVRCRVEMEVRVCGG